MTTIYNNKYDIDGEATGDQSGWSVSMNNAGDIVAIGAINAKNNGNGDRSGHVRVYKQIDGKWEQLGIDIDGEALSNQSGFSVSINSTGYIVAIGARFNNGGSGHVRVHKYIDGVWEQLGIDIDGVSGSRSGFSVSINSAGDIVAIGAPDTNNDAGHVRVWKYIDNPDGKSAKLWSKLGLDINGKNSGDYSGISVSMNSTGYIVAIGAFGNGTGYSRVHQYNGSLWEILGQDIYGETPGDRSGDSISINSAGNIVAIGARNARNVDGVFQTGHVRVHKYNGSSWKRSLDIDGEASVDNSGISVSMNSAGDIVAIGAPRNDGNGDNSGHVRVWKLIADKWERLGLDINGESAGDNSGISVSMNSEGTIVAIGANFNDDGGDDSGHARVFYYRNNAWNQAPPGFFKVSDGTFTISDTGLFTVQ
jgi:hypothetical protein